MKKELNKVILNALINLLKHQKDDGSFLSLSSPHRDFKNPLVFHSLFTSAIILSSLNDLKDKKALAIKEKIVKFLSSQKSENWSFNYWSKASDQYKTIPYPDDLDDTFCALAGLYLFDKSLISGKALASITKLLTSLEVAEGGPYITWVVNKKAHAKWRDVDIAVNANIAYFLSLLEIELPALSKLFSEKIKNNTLSSPYYPDEWPIIYFLSRFYNGQQKNKLIKMAEEKRVENPLHAALKVLTLVSMGKPVDQKLIAMILENKKNGFWKAYPFYSGVNPNRDGYYFAGSEDLTSAICINALSKYNESQVKEKKVVGLERIHEQVIEQSLNHFDRGEIKKEVGKVLTSLVSENKSRQITLLPFFFKLALGENGSKISTKTCIQLGAANLLGWIAYSLYDDVMDEGKEAKMISVANIAMRKCILVIEEHLKEKSQKEFVRIILDSIDKANYWELSIARHNNPDWGNYDRLAQKSMGHALGPLCILFLLGYSTQSKEVKSLVNFFKHFIIAKQLNDDAHDWQEDIARNNITPVVDKILKRVNKNRTDELLQKTFWYEVIEEVANEIFHHIDLAKKNLNKTQIIQHPNYLSQLLEKIEKGTNEALAEKKRTVEFLTVYK